MVVIYSDKLTYFEQITKRNILSNRFYAALEIFSEPTLYRPDRVNHACVRKKRNYFELYNSLLEPTEREASRD